MAKTYCTCIGMRGERTARGGYDGCRASVQSWSGSIIVSNYVDRDTEEVTFTVGTNDNSSCASDWHSHDFRGSLEEFKELLNLRKAIKEGQVSVVVHKGSSFKLKHLKK